MTNKNYGEQLQDARISQDSALMQTLFTLKKVKDEYYILIDKLAAIGHRLQNTNTPPGELKDKATKMERPEGILSDINDEITQISNNNNLLSRVVDKFSSLI